MALRARKSRLLISTAKILGIFSPKTEMQSWQSIFELEPLERRLFLAANPVISGPTTFIENSSYTLSLASNDPGATIDGWVVDWGDGSDKTTTFSDVTTLDHVYKDEGHYTISASVTEASSSSGTGGTYDSNPLPVEEVPLPPVVAILGNTSLFSHTTFTGSVMTSFTGEDTGVADTDDTIQRIVIDWGDSDTSTFDAPAEGMPNPLPISHTYNQIGSYTITATAYDNESGQSGSVTKNITVSPVVSGGYQIGAGAPYNLGLSNDTTGVTQWTINWGDGSIPQVVSGDPASVSHVFNGPHASDVITAVATQNGQDYPSNPLPIVVRAGAEIIPPLTNVAVNFQPAPSYEASGTPSGSLGEGQTSGTLVDTGSVFADHVNYTSVNIDYALGWDSDQASGAKDRQISGDDHRLDSFVGMQPNGANANWFIGLAVGTYQVHIVAGDPNVTTSNSPATYYQIDVNGTRVVDGAPTSSAWVNGTATVDVTNGRLTVAPGPFAVNNVIDYIEITPTANLSSTPVAPTNLTAKADNGVINLNWQDNADNESGYNVYRSTDGVTFSLITQTPLPMNDSYYSDTSVSGGTTYYYQVKAVNSIGASAASNNAHITALASNAAEQAYGSTPWPVPGTIQAEDFDSGGSGVAYQPDVAMNFGDYYRAGFISVGPAGPNAPGYVVGWNTPNALGLGPEWLNYTINVQTTDTYKLSFSVGSDGPGGTFHVLLDGAAISHGEISVPDTGGWYTFQTISIEDLQLPSTGTHKLTLVMDTVGKDTGVANFDWMQLTPLSSATPAGPINCTAKLSSQNQIQINWTNTSSHQSGFIVQRSSDGGVTYSTISPNLSASATSYLDTTANTGVTYLYVVRAWNGNGESDPSNKSIVATPLSTATALAATDQAIVDSTDVYAPVLDTLPTPDKPLFLKFDLSSVTGTISGAILRLYGREEGSNQTGVTLNIYPTDAGWTGAQLSGGGTAPTLGSMISTETGNEGSNLWYEWDITPYILQQLQAGQHVISLSVQPTVATGSPWKFFSMNSSVAQPVLLVTQGVSAPNGDSISGTVYSDNNDSGVRDPDEGPASGVRVYVDSNGNGQYDAGEPSALTASDGTYTITNIAPGTWNLRVASGTMAVTDPAAGYKGITIATNQTVLNENFGVFQNLAPIFDSGDPPALHLNPYAPVPSFPNNAWPAGAIFAVLPYDHLLVEYGPDGTELHEWPLSKGQSFNDLHSDITQLTFLQDGTLVLANRGLGEVNILSPSDAFDLAGNPTKALGDGRGTTNISPDFHSLSKFSLTDANPSLIVNDALGNVYVGDEGSPGDNNTLVTQGLFKFNSDGSLVNHYVLGATTGGQQIYYGDLESDQHTLLFNNEGVLVDPSAGSAFNGTADVFSLDTNTGQYQQILTNLQGHLDNLYLMRCLPGGDLLMAGEFQDAPDGGTIAPTSEIIRMHIDFSQPGCPGTIVQRYGVNMEDFAPGTLSYFLWGGLALAPDGTSFWAAATEGTGDDARLLYRFDLDTGTVLQKINTNLLGLTNANGTAGMMEGFAEFGEPRAALMPNQDFIYHAVAHDPNGDTITFGLSGNTYGAIINPISGEMTWRPTEPGNYSFTLTATDSHGAQTTKTITISVDFNPNGGVNHAPVFTSDTLSDAEVGVQYTNRAVATDVDGDALTYSLVASPEFQIDPATGTISWMPSLPDQGSAYRQVKVQVSDGRGGITQQTFNIRVLPANSGNHNPAIDTPTNPLTAGGLFAVSGSNATSDLASLNASEPPSYIFTQLQVMPRADTPVEVDIAGSSWQIYSNNNLIFDVAKMPDGELEVFKPLVFTITAFDGDGNDTLQFVPVSMPKGMSIGPTTPRNPDLGPGKFQATITWDPAVDQVGIFNFTIGVRDYAATGVANGGYAQSTFTVTVVNPTLQLAPTATAVPSDDAAWILDAGASPYTSEFDSTFRWTFVPTPGGENAPMLQLMQGNGATALAIAQEPGTYWYQVVGHNDLGDSAPVSVPFIVNDLNATETPVIISAIPVSPSVWQDFTGTVASFVAPSSDVVSDFKAKIYWGDAVDPVDGTVTAGSTAGTFLIQGSNRYTTLGLAPAKVVVYDASTNVELGEGRLDVTVVEGKVPAPTGFKVVALNSSSIWVQWDSISSLGGRVLIKRYDPNGTVDQIDGPSTGGFNYYADQNDLLEGTRYGYQIMFLDNYGNQSAPTPILYATTSFASLSLPTPTAADNGGQVQISWDSWSNAPADFAGWDVLRANYTSDSTKAYSYTSVLGSISPVTGTSFTDQSADPTQKYYYVIEPVISAGERIGISEPALYDGTSNAVLGPPQPPTNVVAGYSGMYAGTRRVGVSWAEVPGGASLGFDVYRGATANFALDAASLIGSSNTTGYTDDTVGSGTYYYAVKAVSVDDNGDEVYSVPTYSSTPVNTAITPDLPPTAPTIDSLVAATGQNAAVTITWTDNSVNEMGFEIRRCVDLNGSPKFTDIDSWTVAGLATQDQTSFVDTGVVSNQKYYYVVLAYDVGSTQNPDIMTGSQGQMYSTPQQPYASVTTAAVGTPPNSPLGLAPDGSNTTYTQIGLTWTADLSGSAPPPVAYYVYRREGGDQSSWSILNTQSSQFKLLTATPITSTSYIDTTVEVGKTYDYEVTAASIDNAQSAPDILFGVSPKAVGGTPLKPIVQILSPAPFSGVGLNFTEDSINDGRIQSLTPVIANIQDLNQLDVSWKLILRPTGAADSAAAADITLGEGVIPAGTPRDPAGIRLCTLDPTLFPSGNYDLMLTATDSDNGITGPGANDFAISLFSQAKTGNLHLPVTDITLDAPGGPVTIQRVYDSQNANILGDFGYGWTLSVGDTHLSTTMSNSVGSFTQGDLVYITLPNGEQHAFQFFPVPDGFSSNSPNDPYGPQYSAYIPQFLCVDGSNATLSVQGDIHSSAGTQLNLHYDGHAYTTEDESANFYNPTNFGNYYELKTADGSIYRLNATTGKLEWTKDPNGNVVTYSFDQNPAIITSGNREIQIDRLNGTIDWIQEFYKNTETPASNQVQFTYINGNLSTAKDLNGEFTTYGYSTVAGQEHLLTTVSAPHLGTTVSAITLTATYNDPLNRLTSLIDGNGNSLPLSNNSNGSSGSQVVADPLGNDTESVYDTHGDVIRSIATVKDSTGAILGYSVTVHDYIYSSGDLSSQLDGLFPADTQGMLPGHSSENVLFEETTYAPFFVDASAAQTRYTAPPPVGSILSTTEYDTTAGDPGQGQPSTVTEYLSTGDTRVTNYAYSNQDGARPDEVTVNLIHGTQHQSIPVSDMSYTYDASGNLTYTTNYLDTDPQTGQGTENDYSPAGGNIPTGLLTATYTTKYSAAGGVQRITQTSQNVYYTLAESTPGDPQYIPGSVYGKIRESIQYLNATDTQSTWYVYDQVGNTKFELTYKTWNDSNGTQHGWIGTQTDYDGDNRATATYQVEFLDANYGGSNAGVLMTTVNGNSVAVAETAYINPGSGASSTLKTSVTNYDIRGRVTSTLDEYGGETDSYFDADGNVVREVSQVNSSTGSPEVRTVYDADGRVIWQTDSFIPADATNLNSTSNTALSTHTIYDSLGRVVETDRYYNTLISVSVSTSDSSIYTSALTEQGTLISSTLTIYDQQGRTVETDRVDASGKPYQQTGTIYYANGQVEYSGTLKAGLINSGDHAWWVSPDTSDPGSYFSSYSKNLYDQVDSSGIYDMVIDADGFKTKTYKDMLGRVVNTVNQDGTSTQTLYGVGNEAVSDHNPTSTNPLIAMPGQTIDGYQVTQIDAKGNATDSFYDRGGRLTDVWQPAPTVPYANVVANDNPLGYWRLGESSGLSASDSSGNGSNGTYSNVTLGQPGALANDSDTAASFSGNNSDVSVPDSASLEITNQLTLECWINYSMSDGIGAPGIITKDDGYIVRGYGLYAAYLHNEHLEFALNVGGTQQVLTTPGSYNDGKWHHVVATYDGSNMLIYVDGGAVAEMAASGAISTNSDPLMIGTFDNADRDSHFQGSIDEAAVYNHVLSAAQISQHYHTGEAMFSRPHWHYAYDTAGNMISETDPNNHTTTFTYGEQGHQYTQTIPDAGDGPSTETTTYDQHGRILEQTDFDGNVADYSYGNTGASVAEVSSINYKKNGSTTETVNYHYDRYGRKQEVDDVTNGVPADTFYNYDEAGGVVAGGTTAVPGNFGDLTSIESPQGTIHYVYDAVTGLKIETWTSAAGDTTNARVTDTLYGYDTLGRLASVTIALQNQQAPLQQTPGTYYDAEGNPFSTNLPTTLYLYDGDGNLKTQLNPNNTETDYDYTHYWDVGGGEEIVKNKRTSDSTTLSQFTYTFDANRNKISELDQNVMDPGEGVSSSALYTWVYDADDRLVSERYDYGNNDTATTGHTADDYTDTYSYDPAGNRLRKTHDTASDGIIDQTIVDTYDSRDRQIGETDNATYQTLFQYDDNGSPTSIHQERLSDNSTLRWEFYFYDARGRMNLARVLDGVTNISTTSNYTLDDEGNVVAMSIYHTDPNNPVVTTYLIDPLNPSGYAKVLETRVAGTLTTTYSLGLAVIAQNQNGTISFIMPDGHGSTCQLTAYTSDSSNGHVVARYDYDAFGGQLTFTASTHAANTANTSILYVGEMLDPVTGKYVMGAREYNPQEGRFLTRDSYLPAAGDIGNANLYLYVGGDPLNLTDPSGHEGSVLGTVASVGIGLSLMGMWVGMVGRAVYNGVIAPAPTVSPSEVSADVKSFALLSRDVYSSTPAGAGNWRPATERQLVSLGLGNVAFAFTKGDFAAQLYVSQTSNAYVLAFAGTDQVGDVWSDVAQGAAGSHAPLTQFPEAVELAKVVSNAVGKSPLTMTGHSLGGGLAAAAAIATNRPMVSFNAAGLSASSIRNFGTGAYTATADNYFVDGDLVTNIINDVPFAPAAFGSQHMLERPPGYEWSIPVHLHSINTVIKALGMN